MNLSESFRTVLCLNPICEIFPKCFTEASDCLSHNQCKPITVTTL